MEKVQKIGERKIPMGVSLLTKRRQQEDQVRRIP